MQATPCNPFLTALSRTSATSRRMELPFDAHVLAPLMFAWRSTAPTLPDKERAKLVLEQLRSAALLAFDTPDEVARAVGFLRDAGIDVDAPLAATASPSLAPPEAACVVCGCPTLAVHRRADVTGWTCSYSLPRKLSVFEKECPDCATMHAYGRVTTRPTLLVPVESPTRVPKDTVERISELRNALPVAVRLTRRRPDSPTPVLLRGFDHGPVRVSIDGPVGGVVDGVRELLSPLVAAGVERHAAAAVLGAPVARYRASALAGEWFLRAGTSAEAGHEGTAFASELLALLTSLMERTQIGFSGLCMSLHTAACSLQTTQTAGRGAEVPLLDHEVLAAAWFEHELLQLSRLAGVPPPPADVPFVTRSNFGGARAEEVLGAAFEALKRSFRATWAEGHDRHCTRRGNCRLLVMDGNAKVWRRTCSQRYRFYDSAPAPWAANPPRRVGPYPSPPTAAVSVRVPAVLPGYGWVHKGCTARPLPRFYDCAECLSSAAVRSAREPREPAAAEAEAEALARRPAHVPDPDDLQADENDDPSEPAAAARAPSGTPGLQEEVDQLRVVSIRASDAADAARVTAERASSEGATASASVARRVTRSGGSMVDAAAKQAVRMKEALAASTEQERRLLPQGQGPRYAPPPRGPPPPPGRPPALLVPVRPVSPVEAPRPASPLRARLQHATR